MRGADTFTENLFTLRKLEDFVPADHPLRSIRKMANAALAKKRWAPQHCPAEAAARDAVASAL